VLKERHRTFRAFAFLHPLAQSAHKCSLNAIARYVLSRCCTRLRKARTSAFKNAIARNVLSRFCTLLRKVRTQMSFARSTQMNFYIACY
jgi:GTP1/Obg family GTP-binding protein